MSNPYQTPSLDSSAMQPGPDYVAATPENWTWISQVRIVAILNAVQGGLEIAMGLFYAAMGFAIPALMKFQQMNAPNVRRNAEMPPEQMAWIMTAIYAGIGAVIVVCGALRIFAGIQNFRFRGRTLGLVSLVVGLASSIGCYCLPTGVAILVYGLIVYLNPAVASAFQMGSSGQSPAEILAAFAPYRQPTYGPPPG